MGRMESNNIEETQPAASHPEQQPLDETRPTPLTDDELGQTHPTPVIGNAVDQTRQVQTSPSVVTPELTQPAAVPPAYEPPAESSPTPARPQRSRTWIWLSLVGVFILLLVAVGSVYAGYQAAIRQRLGFQSTQVAAEAQAQFDLGVQDSLAGRYDLARQRFEYVLQINPNFPGVTDQLAMVLLALNTTATPTFVPTPTLVPTLDTRGRDELFTQAQAAMLAGDWTTAIDTLLTLRKREPAFMAVKVDGMLFVALRNRGVDKIARQADLEGGTYDLALAERFGPLDVEARNWRDWATLYVRGASFWDVDWAQAVYYFSQLVLIAPNLMDGSGYTAWERNILALIGYGDWFARQEMYCDARDQYDAALELRGDPVVQPTADYAVKRCEEGNIPAPIVPGDTMTPTPTLEGGMGESTPTPTATVEVPTETPTPETAYP
jgi:tetratricopeptide (TPR) repeat protein